MQLPAFFGRKRSINLLPRDEFESSTLGIVLEWALVFGKWAVIVTQLVVMGVFLWRFTLDRRQSDLNASIAKDVAIVKSYAQVEQDFDLAQKQVNFASPVLATQQTTLSVFDHLASATPPDVWYDHISTATNAVTLTAYSASLGGFGQFLTALQHDPLFTNVIVSQIQDGGAKGAQLQFDLTLAYGGNPS